MKTITLAALREQVERRKTLIGWIDDETAIDALRNAGAMRTDRKRALLARIEARAAKAGRKAPPSRY